MMLFIEICSILRSFISTLFTSLHSVCQQTRPVFEYFVNLPQPYLILMNLFSYSSLVLGGICHQMRHVCIATPDLPTHAVQGYLTDGHRLQTKQTRQRNQNQNHDEHHHAAEEDLQPPLHVPPCGGSLR